MQPSQNTGSVTGGSPALPSQNTGSVTGAKGGRPRLYATGAERSRAYRRRKRAARFAQDVSVHFRHDTDVWETPQRFFDMLNAEFHFTVDVCADASNAKCAQYFTPEQDGLKQRWEAVCFMNPPYGAEIGRWVQKAFESSLFGATVVCLLPARTDTRWWHNYVTLASEIRYLPRRLKFGGAANSAPFPSAVVIFRPFVS